MRLHGFLLYTVCISFLSPIREIAVNCSIVGSVFDVSDNPGDVHFYLFPSQSNTSYREELMLYNLSSIESSSLKKDVPTIILIHGFWSNLTTHFPQDVKNAYLEHYPERNYIVVDWGPLAFSPDPKGEKLYPIVYVEVVKTSIPIVGQRIADFVLYLKKNNYISLDKLHLVGHSLGAHLAGRVGHALQKHPDGGKVSRITGLDPAGPLFDVMKFHRKLVKDDADFVDVYHTAMGPMNYGDFSKDGHVDFYPNGGVKQPPCEDYLSPFDPFGLGSCSHQFVIDIYIATISKKILACECNSFINLVVIYKCRGNCSSQVLAGEPCPSHARGLYHFTTSDKP